MIAKARNWQLSWIADYTIKSYIYICFITDIEHSLFMGIANYNISFIIKKKKIYIYIYIYILYKHTIRGIICNLGEQQNKKDTRALLSGYCQIPTPEKRLKTRS